MALAATVRSLARGFHGTSAVFVQDLRTGAGAAWNARARFPAASTLKLAIAVDRAALADGRARRGPSVDVLLHRMLVYSDNASANALEVWLAGSTSAGSAGGRDDARARPQRLGMYGGYSRAVAGRADPDARRRPARASASASTRPPGTWPGSRGSSTWRPAEGTVLGVAGSRRRRRASSSGCSCTRPDRRKLDRFLARPSRRTAQGGLEHLRPARRGDRFLARAAPTWPR